MSAKEKTVRRAWCMEGNRRPAYHMLPVMSSAPSGRLRALSAYSFRGLSPDHTNTDTFRLSRRLPVQI